MILNEVNRLISEALIHRNLYQIQMNDQENYFSAPSLYKKSLNDGKKVFLHRNYLMGHYTLFPFSLTSEATSWPEELSQGSIMSWNELKVAFINVTTQGYTLDVT